MTKRLFGCNLLQVSLWHSAQTFFIPIQVVFWILVNTGGEALYIKFCYLKYADGYICSLDVLIQ